MSFPFVSSVDDPSSWARASFAQIALGDVRNTRSLVRLATGVAKRPAGRVTQVFDADADRQAAYGLLSNPRVRSQDILRGLRDSSARRYVQARRARVYVACDGSSLRITDRSGYKGTGRIGTTRTKARGFEVLSAVSIDESGTPLDLVGQHYWARIGKHKRGSHKQRKLADKETAHAVQLLQDIDDAFHNAHQEADEEVDVHCRPCVLLDRGYDARYVLLKAVELRARMDTIVRASHNRRVVDAQDKYLRGVLERQPVLCEYQLAVPAGANRKARVARMRVRACEVTLRLRDPWTKVTHTATLSAVWTREVGTTPRGEKPIDWLLLTTLPVSTAAQACEVIRAYSFRWRVEEFHRAWKSGVCCVEDTELRCAEAIQKWAIVLATVAVRAVHLARVARSTPDVSATTEFSAEEIEAVIVLRRPKGVRLDAPHALQQVVGWVAELGGYTGKSSGGPPGPTVIGRGLLRVTSAAQAIRNLRELQADEEM